MSHATTESRWAPLIACTNPQSTATIAKILEHYVPDNLIALLARAHITITALDSRTYAQASPVIGRLGTSFDQWPVPPAGLFVSQERTVYLRTVEIMAIVHELGHGVDLALGNGADYLSTTDPQIGRMFDDATTFVTPYAASGKDEFFAEIFRAYCNANSPNSRWPPVSRERLERCSPDMLAYLEPMLTASYELAA